MLLTNLRLVLSAELIERGWLQIHSGRIVALGDGVPRPDAGRAVDGAGLTAIPGMINLHDAMLEHELKPHPSVSFPIDMAIYELDKRLAAAGITVAYTTLSFWDQHGQKRMQQLARVRNIVEELQRLRPHLLTDLRVHARFEMAMPSGAPLLGELIENSQIDRLSLMDHSPDQGQDRNLERYVSALAEERHLKRDHLAEELRERLVPAGNVAQRWALAHDLVQLAAASGLPIASYADASAARVDLMATLGATLAEFPLTMAAAEQARQRGMYVAMSAPRALRGVASAGHLSVREALSAGLVDCLAADYHPGTLVQTVFGLAREGVMSLPQAVALVTSGPATVIGRQDAGSLTPGMRADLCLIEDVSRPRVRGTLRGGTPIYWDQTMWARTL